MVSLELRFGVQQRLSERNYPVAHIDCVQPSTGINLKNPKRLWLFVASGVIIRDRGISGTEKVVGDTEIPPTRLG